MFIRPATNPESGGPYLIRDPMTMRHLSNDGEEMPDTDYWQRRLAEGGVELCEPQAKEPEPALPEPHVEPADHDEEAHQ